MVMIADGEEVFRHCSRQKLVGTRQQPPQIKY